MYSVLKIKSTVEVQISKYKITIQHLLNETGDFHFHLSTLTQRLRQERDLLSEEPKKAKLFQESMHAK